jgi:hypothetical protein
MNAPSAPIATFGSLHVGRLGLRRRLRAMAALLGLLGFLGIDALLEPSLLRAASPEQEAEAAILPFLDVFASPPSGSAQAFLIKGRVESLGALSFGSNPPAFELAVEPPSRMRLQFPLGNTSFVACRNHQTLWAAPGSDLQPYLDALPLPANPKAAQNQALRDLRLPFSGRQLELFPALLQIVPKGTSTLETIPCEVVDVRILPQLAKLLPPEAEGWALRLWMSPQKRPVRLGLQHPLGSAVLRIDHVQFSTSLPAELWRPTPEAVAIPASRFQALLQNLGRPPASKPSAPPRTGN